MRAQSLGQFGVHRRAGVDLDPDDALGHAGVKDAGHLVPREPEP
jgi:hypothetical protein